MLAQDYHRFQSLMADKGVIFSYCGFVSETILFALGEALKRKMEIEETDTNVAKRVFSVFVEQVQNIIRYSKEREAPEPPPAMGQGMIVVGAERDQFFVVCGNPIHSSNVDRLRERLSHIRSLDKKELKAFYREKLREPAEEESQGASIGLIEIARRTSSPIDFDFFPLEDDTTFFCLKAYI